MNSIFTEQNQERQLSRLAAQRQLYATAKTIVGAQLITAGPVTVVFALLVAIQPDLKSYASIWGLILALCDLAWLTPWQKRLREQAARIQEVFDCDVLALPWNDLKAGKRPDPELIHAASVKYRSWARKMPPLTDWYAIEIARVPLAIARIACQRSNCWWDSEQRRRYSKWAMVVLIITFSLVFGLSLCKQLTLEDFILKVLVPLLPLGIIGVRQINEQLDAAKRLDTLKEHAEKLWADALNGSSESDLTQRCRGLQDEILESRRKSPLVPDFIYKRLQRDYESRMNQGVAELVTEANRRMVSDQ